MTSDDAHTLPCAGWSSARNRRVDVNFHSPAVHERAIRLGAASDRAPPPALDPARIERGRWMVLTRPGCARRVRTALGPLIELRRGVAAAADVVETEDDDVVTIGRRLQGAHYILLIGGADQFSYGLQIQLDHRVIVGRLALDDAGLRAYAKRVVAYESGSLATDARTDLVTPSPLDGAMCIASNALRSGLPTSGADTGDPSLWECDHDGLLAWAEQVVAPRVGVVLCHGGADLEELGAWMFAKSGRLQPVDPATVRGSRQFAHGAVLLSPACYGSGTSAHATRLAERGKWRHAMVATDVESHFASALMGHPRGPVAYFAHHGPTAILAIEAEPFAHVIAWYRSVEARRRHVTLGEAVSTFRELRGRSASEHHARTYETPSGELHILAARAMGYLGYVLHGDPALRVLA